MIWTSGRVGGGRARRARGTREQAEFSIRASTARVILAKKKVFFCLFIFLFFLSNHTERKTAIRMAAGLCKLGFIRKGEGRRGGGEWALARLFLERRTYRGTSKS